MGLHIPEAIECPQCGLSAPRHCVAAMYPGARCNWYCCVLPSKGGCGTWTTIIPSPKGKKRWVIKQMRVIDRGSSAN